MRKGRGGRKPGRVRATPAVPAPTLFTKPHALPPVSPGMTLWACFWVLVNQKVEFRFGQVYSLAGGGNVAGGWV